MKLPGGHDRWQRGARRLVFALALLGAASGGAAGESLLGHWGLRPIYQSEYKVYRQESQWNQSFDLDRTAPWASLHTGLRIQSKEDETRNDYKFANDEFSLSVARQSGIGNLAVSGRTQRQKMDNAYSRDARGTDNLSLTNLLPLLEQEGRSLALSFGGGWVQQKQDLETRRTSTTTDNTVSTGWEGQAALDATWQVEDDLKLSARTSWSGSLESSDTRHEVQSATSTTLSGHSATDHSRNNQLQAEMLWSRMEALNLQVKLGFSDAMAQYYQATAQTQETKDSRSHSFYVAASGKPTDQLDYRFEVTNKGSSFDHKVEAKDMLDALTDFTLTARYLPLLPLISGSTLQGAASYTTKRTERENQASYNTHTTSLDLRGMRPLGSRFNVSLHGTTSLEQDYYSDGGGERDRLTTRLVTTLGYQMKQKLRINIFYNVAETENVNVRRAYAAQNKVDRTYSVNSDYKLTLPAGVEVSQTFQISAAYTYYTYNENSNALTRTNRVTSRVAAPLFSRVRLTLEHIYEKANSGAYRYSTTGGQRLYNRAADRLRQDLKTGVEYRVSSMLSFSVLEQLWVTSNQQVATGAISRRENHQITGKVHLRRDLAGGLKLTASFEHTESNQIDPYWRINAKVEKRFE